VDNKEYSGLQSVAVLKPTHWALSFSSLVAFVSYVRTQAARSRWKWCILVQKPFNLQESYFPHQMQPFFRQSPIGSLFVTKQLCQLLIFIPQKAFPEISEMWLHVGAEVSRSHAIYHLVWLKVIQSAPVLFPWLHIFTAGLTCHNQLITCRNSLWAVGLCFSSS